MAPVGPRPQPPAGSCKLAVNGILFNSSATTNVFWLNLTSGGSPNVPDLTSLITSILASYKTNVLTQQSSSFKLANFVATWIPTVGAAYETAVTDATAGSLTTGSDNNATSAVINWGINRYYRGGHPRTYLPGVADSDIANGRTLSSARQAAIAAGAQAWLTAVNALTHGDITACKLGTVSFQNGDVWRSPPVFEAYQSVKMRAFLGNQRRRIR